MKQLRGYFLFLALASSTVSVCGQTQTAPAAVEIVRKPISEIPEQYRADAPKAGKPMVAHYTCPESGRLYVVFDNVQQTATVEAGNTIYYLKQTRSADGGRYANSNDSYVFWVKGKSATINNHETCEAD